MNDLEKIEKILRKGLFSLSESLYQHWPLPDDDKNEISESNIIIHLAHSFLSEGYIVFSEYRIKKNEHQDLRIISPEKNFEIWGECKRYLKMDSTGISSDIKRLLSSANQLPIDKNERPLFGMVVFLTRETDVHDWWINSKREKLPAKTYSSDEWEKIWTLLKDHEIYCGSFPMAYHGKEGFYHMGLYGVFELSRP